MEIKDVFENSSLPRLDTELLLAFSLKKSREFLLSHLDYEIKPNLYKKFQTLENKRRQDWPVAYLIGVKEFYGLGFKVNPDVLTPRPETEKMVEDIVGLTKESKFKKQLIIDLGTGSGAIIIAVAKELERTSPPAYRRAEFLAADISARALKIAKQNAAEHRLLNKIKFYQGDLLTPLKLDGRDLSHSELIIAANLPYLTKKQIKESPSIKHEPRLALDGGPDGLKYYRRLFKQLSILQNIGAVRVICEIDDSQAGGIGVWAKKYFPHTQSKIVPDLSGKKRFLAL